MVCVGTFQPSEDRKQSLKHCTACSIPLYQTAFPRNAAPGLVSTWKGSFTTQEGGKAGSHYPKHTWFLQTQVSTSHCADVPLLVFQASSESSFPCGSSPPQALFSCREKAAVLLPFWSGGLAEGVRGGGCSGNSSTLMLLVCFSRCSAALHETILSSRGSLSDDILTFLCDPYSPVCFPWRVRRLKPIPEHPCPQGSFVPARTSASPSSQLLLLLADS